MSSLGLGSRSSRRDYVIEDIHASLDALEAGARCPQQIPWYTAAANLPNALAPPSPAVCAANKSPIDNDLKMATKTLTQLISDLVLSEGITTEAALRRALPPTVADDDSRVCPILFDCLHTAAAPAAPAEGSKASRVKRRKPTRKAKLPYHQCELHNDQFDRYYQVMPTDAVCDSCCLCLMPVL